jgi:hypothetical protein
MTAEPALVGAFFVPQRMPYWYGPEMDSKFEVLGGAADFAVGQKITISGNLRTYQMTLTVVVTGFEYARFLEWRFQDSYGVKGMQSWRIEAGAANGGSSREGTMVRMRDEYEHESLLGRILDPVFTRFAVARRDQYWLERLKSLVERSGKAG